jgi:hypothetical protein
MFQLGDKVDRRHQWREVLRRRLEVLEAAQQDDGGGDSHRPKADEGAAKGVL